MEKINIGCKLPHGLVLEVGIRDMKLASDYAVAVLQGRLQARPGAKYGSTMVHKALWDRWLALNKTLRYVVDKSVFVIP